MANKESGVETISRFTRRTLIVIGLASLVAVLLFFAGQLIDVMLLVFASILVAVAIDGAVRDIDRYPNGAAIAQASGEVSGRPVEISQACPRS